MNRRANIVNMVFGSHLYGLNTENSDMDFKGIYLPNKNELLLNNYGKTYNHTTGGTGKNTKEDVDTEVIALPYFIKGACQGETFALDMLHCKTPIGWSDYSEIWEDLISKRTKFYSKDMKAYMGYVRKQASKYGLKGTRLASISKAIETLSAFDKDSTLSSIPKDIIYKDEYAKFVNYSGKGAGVVEQEFYEVNSKKYQTTNSIGYVVDQLSIMYDSYGARAKQAEVNEGVDWKAVSHAFRAGYQARDIYKYGDFEYPLKENSFIMQVKTGVLDYKTQVSHVLEDLVEEVDSLAENSALPTKCDTVYWDNWLLSVYEDYVL